MQKTVTTINQKDFEADKAIEIEGEVFDIPSRTGELDRRISELERQREGSSEYDFIAANIEAIFGKANAKKILKDGLKTNLDYLSKIYRTAMALIYEKKLEAEQEELERRTEALAPITNAVDKVAPILGRL